MNESRDLLSSENLQKLKQEEENLQMKIDAAKLSLNTIKDEKKRIALEQQI